MKELGETELKRLVKRQSTGGVVRRLSYVSIFILPLEHLTIHCLYLCHVRGVVYLSVLAARAFFGIRNTGASSTPTVLPSPPTMIWSTLAMLLRAGP